MAINKYKGDKNHEEDYTNSWPHLRVGSMEYPNHVLSGTADVASDCAVLSFGSIGVFPQVVP